MDILPRKDRQIQRRQPGAIRRDDLLRHRREARTEVHRRFDDQNVHVIRIDPRRSKHFRIQGLGPVATDDHPNPVHVDHRRLANRVPRALAHGPLVLVTSVVDQLHTTLDIDRLAVHVIRLRTQRRLDPVSHTHLFRFRDRIRIVNRPNSRTRHTLGNQLPQDGHTVIRSAAPGVVRHIIDQHRCFFRCLRQSIAPLGGQ